MKPAMKRTVAWQRVDTVGLEYAEIELNPMRLQGEIVVVEDGIPFAVSYRVECDSPGTTVRTLVRCKRRKGHTELALLRSAEGRWTMNGAPQSQLEGVSDIDLSVTPSTNTPPLRRLSLSVGQYAEVTAAWLRFPNLDIVPLRQTYRRVSPEKYVYEAKDLNFSAEIECDEDSIVRTYAGLWTRAV